MPGMRIRAATPSDAEAITVIATQPSVVWGTLQLPAQDPGFWQKRLAGNDPNTNFVLVAEIEGKVVGLGGLHWSPRARTRHVADLGMFIHEAHQGQGVGTALMTALVDAADKWLGFVRLELEVYPDNERAVKLYEKFGFQVEGCKRMNVFRDGRYVDSLVMGRIRPDMQ